MGVREESLQLLWQGLSPKEIAHAKGVSIDTTLGYLDQLVGRGDLRRSDIFFSVPKSIRNSIPASLISSGSFTIQAISNLLKQTNIDVDTEDILVMIKYGDSRHALGDMYEDVRTIETHLHQIIRDTLIEKYGEGEMEWWRQGIPLPIRQTCQSRREEDEDPVEEPYCYTDLLDLWHILDKQWIILKDSIPDEFKGDKRSLRDKLIRLNRIRREVMHPVRGIIPSEEDFDFIREFKVQLGLSVMKSLFKTL
jgi:hypothetical protein